MIRFAARSRTRENSLLLAGRHVVNADDVIRSGDSQLLPVGIEGLVYLSGHCSLGKGAIGSSALMIAETECSPSFGQAVASGILCNALVWLTFSARSTTDRILAIVPPITAFVACGFEHSVENLYFIPPGRLIKATASDSFWTQVSLRPEALPHLTWEQGLLNNLLPVTLGNILGGSPLVGLVY